MDCVMETNGNLTTLQDKATNHLENGPDHNNSNFMLFQKSMRQVSTTSATTDFVTTEDGLLRSASIQLNEI